MLLSILITDGGSLRLVVKFFKPITEILFVRSLKKKSNCILNIYKFRVLKMSSSQGKHMPKDTQIIVSIMKDLGINEYDQQVLNHLLEFNYSEL